MMGVEVAKDDGIIADPKKLADIRRIMRVS
jgi:hypothetical protein